MRFWVCFRNKHTFRKILKNYKLHFLAQYLQNSLWEHISDKKINIIDKIFKSTISVSSWKIIYVK